MQSVFRARVSAKHGAGGRLWKQRLCVRPLVARAAEEPTRSGPEDAETEGAEFDMSGYISPDPMFHGKWVEIEGVDVKMPDYDFAEYSWMQRVSSDIGWPAFWRYEAL
jgi:hypothetical protein